MPRIGFTRVQEAWCRVPKSPRESREVTGVMFRKPVGKKKSLMLLWRVSPRLVGDCREVASQSALDWGLWQVSPRLVGDCREVDSQSALDWGLWLCGESVRAWLGTVAKWPVSPRLIGDCGYVASQSALGWGLSRSGQSVRA
ncbi:hypothetical protein ACLB2K_006831 [Fragaria x ananassa]